MITALIRAFAQLGDPAIRKVIWISVGGALAVLVLLVAGTGIVLDQVTLVDWGWLDGTIDVIATLGTVFLAIILFPAIAVTISTLMLEEVAAAVERRHYPSLPAARPIGIVEGLLSGLRFFGVWIVVNGVALALTLLLPFVNIVVFYCVNGYLLGREYYEIVAFRRLPPREARSLRRRNRGFVFAAGIVIALMMTIPIVNLFAPVVATAFVVHIYQRLATKNSEAS